MKACGKRTC